MIASITGKLEMVGTDSAIMFPGIYPACISG